MNIELDVEHIKTLIWAAELALNNLWVDDEPEISQLNEALKAIYEAYTEKDKSL